MKKLLIPIAVVSLTATLVTGCGGNDQPTRTQGVNERGQNRIATRTYDNRNQTPRFTPLDKPETAGNNGANAGTATENTGTATEGTTAETGTAAGNAGNAGKKFKDIATGDWYANYVEWGTEQGLLSGYPDGSFQPNKPLTRAEVIKIIGLMAEKGYFNTPTPTTDATTTAPGEQGATTPGAGTTDTTGGGTAGGTTGGTTATP